MKGQNAWRSGKGRVKVAQFIWSLELGGAEGVVASIARFLDRDDFESIVICMNHEGRLAPDLESDGIRVIALNKKSGVDIGFLRRLMRILREEGVEILHAHLFGAAFWGRLAGRLTGVPRIVVHEHGMQPWRGSFHFLLDKILAVFTYRFLFASAQVRDFYISKTGVEQEKCVVITNGVTCSVNEEMRARVREANGWSQETHVIVSVGRLSPEKGHAGLVGAFASLVTDWPNAVLVIVGDGKERSRLDTLISELELGDFVKLTGPQDDVDPWLAGADLYVQPSLREGLSLAVLEAMDAGLPVIATRVGDIEKAIDDAINGFLVAPNDQRELSNKINEVLMDLSNLGELKRAARKSIRANFSLESMVEQVQDAYEV